jgi:hypothetical protein
MPMHARSSVAAIAGAAAVIASLAACTAGITSQGPAATVPAAAAARSVAASHSAAPGPASSRVPVSGPLGSFPVPPGAQVGQNITSGKQTLIIMGSVTPQQVSRFYLAELPLLGYKITSNTLITGNNDGGIGSGATLDFTGHGYKGEIVALNDMPTASPDLGISGSDALEVSLTRQ